MRDRFESVEIRFGHVLLTSNPDKWTMWEVHEIESGKHAGKLKKKKPRDFTTLEALLPNLQEAVMRGCGATSWEEFVEEWTRFRAWCTAVFSFTGGGEPGQHGLEPGGGE